GAVSAARAIVVLAVPWRLRRRQPDHEPCAPGRIDRRDLAVHAACESSRPREAETCPMAVPRALRAAPARLEDRLAVGRRDSRSIVVDRVEHRTIRASD